MLFAILAVLALGLTIPGYLKRQPILAFAGGGFWVLLGLYMYSQSVYPTTEVWDIYYGGFWVCIGLVIVCVLEPAIMRNPKEKLETEDMDISEVDGIDKEYEDLAKQTRGPRLGGGGAYARSARSRGSKSKSKPKIGPQY